MTYINSDLIKHYTNDSILTELYKQAEMQCERQNVDKRMGLAVWGEKCPPFTVMCLVEELKNLKKSLKELNDEQ